MTRKDYKKSNIKNLPKHNYSQMFAAIGQVCSVAFTYPDHLFILFNNASPLAENMKQKRSIEYFML